MNSKPVIVSTLAQREIDAAASFFESRKEGLGAEFAERVAEALDAIEIAPGGYQQVYKDLRRCGLRHFPDWGLWFRILPDQSVVIACLSGKRSPALVRERAAGIIPIKQPEP